MVNLNFHVSSIAFDGVLGWVVELQVLGLPANLTNHNRRGVLRFGGVNTVELVRLLQENGVSVIYLLRFKVDVHRFVIGNKRELRGLPITVS